MGGLLQPVVLRALRPMGNVRLRCCFGQRLWGRRGARVWRFRCPWSAAVRWAASMARPGPALRAPVGAMVGSSVPVSTPPAERWRCGLGHRRERGSGGRRWRRPRGWAEAMSRRPRHGALAACPAAGRSAVLAAPALPSSALSTVIVSQRPFRQCGQVSASIPATRWRKAAAFNPASTGRPCLRC